MTKWMIRGGLAAIISLLSTEMGRAADLIVQETAACPVAEIEKDIDESVPGAVAATLLFAVEFVKGFANEAGRATFVSIKEQIDRLTEDVEEKAWSVVPSYAYRRYDESSVRLNFGCRVIFWGERGEWNAAAFGAGWLSPEKIAVAKALGMAREPDLYLELGVEAEASSSGTTPKEVVLRSAHAEFNRQAGDRDAGNDAYDVTVSITIEDPRAAKERRALGTAFFEWGALQPGADVEERASGWIALPPVRTPEWDLGGERITPINIRALVVEKGEGPSLFDALVEYVHPR